ncbi:CrcB family protein [Saxibacter everestensis]|uniref:Fluoride-specific ion channel FluC n=1 Tax=Saxibacter everestensis TaxID=2909229 RepID=A0ABY8QV92_9MICO|nr:CrcB family protein [Brevibacteriaceae bacterium ZFBP1038]
MTFLLVALCGGVGAMVRFIVDSLIKARWDSDFPAATVIINVSGSYLIGLITGATAFGGAQSWHLFVAVGFCGGYTTFSAAMVETVRLIQAQRIRLAFLNAFGSLAMAIAAAIAGIATVAGVSALW